MSADVIEFAGTREERERREAARRGIAACREELKAALQRREYRATAVAQ
jgi:hypothetical protein